VKIVELKMHPQCHVDSGSPKANEGKKDNKVIPIIQKCEIALDFVVLE
jgi:hypothetical protein